jgi:uncharacterized membrane protein
VAASIGYGDRLAFVAAAGGTVAGAVPLWVPALYLLVPGIEIVAALLKADVGRRLARFLIATVVAFPADVAASVVAVLAHLRRRPHQWYNPRWVRDGESRP